MAIDESLLSPDSRTLSPLPRVLFQGLIAVSVCGFVSFLFSTSLFLYLTYRFVQWRWKTGSAPTNQFLLLIYNLLLADIQQSLAFLLNVTALRNNALTVGNATCWAQGWFLSTGDLASSIFILAIALHTFMDVIKGRKLSNTAFICGIAACWIFNYVLVLIGALSHPEDFYVRAGAWCWVNVAYQDERLWLHYFWVFVSTFGTIIIYGIILVTLRHRSRSSNAHPTSTPQGVTPLMVMYPTIYTVCTIPLACGRIASMAGNNVDLSYFCFAGSMIACNGFFDVLLYSMTRRGIVFSEDAPGHNTLGIETFLLVGKGINMGNITTIEANGNARATERGHGRTTSGRLGGRGNRRGDPSASTENLYAMNALAGGAGPITAGFGGIKAETTVQVNVVQMHSSGYELQEMNNTLRTQSENQSRDNLTWEGSEG